MIILFPPADEAALEAKLETIRADIIKLGGTVDAMTRMGRNNFARPLRKKDSGFYVLFTFSLEPSQLAPLRERLKLNGDILRAQIVLAVARAQETSKPAEITMATTP
ncbi:MAG: 30S ribosomal protein S6 [Verrucomicrobia bacterium]|nr:30S ribosomal protein S6 [Verrucomicrobiota bacterium]MBU4246798.1 30S ribosomal protein S6 [Verrucomicrobiota bacterium]MBU4290568.1 30S ribosomal protein S6 [Verrucomicrobiota bacterium]MBU4496592.1 30S ribosomal protein S6 [Verrucomicrobiota bacterium]MCG2681216.1 30S ribosomal protein S6 [Kiritimatiellia bacterium]